MGRDSLPKVRVARSRVPLHRRLRVDTAAVRWWTGACCLAALTGGLVAESHQRADTARTAWGATTAVLVTDGSLKAGEPLLGRVHEVRWPRTLAPDDPVRTLRRGARAATDLGAGVPLVHDAVRGAPTSGDGARVAIAIGDVVVATAVGDRVDLWSTADPLTVADGEPATFRVARRARVTALDEGSLTVALRPVEVPAVAEALATATITVVGEG